MCVWAELTNLFLIGPVRVHAQQFSSQNLPCFLRFVLFPQTKTFPTPPTSTCKKKRQQKPRSSLLFTSVSPSTTKSALSFPNSPPTRRKPHSQAPNKYQDPMDFPRLVRRLSSYSLDEDTTNPLAAVAPSSTRSGGLTVDTSLTKSASFRITPHNKENPTPTSTRSEKSDHDKEHVLRRRRSNSECLMLVKANGTQDLPGPCKEYISSVKQILARTNEESRPEARRRSMSMRHNTIIGDHTMH